VEQLSQPKPHKTWGANTDFEYKQTHYAKPISEVSPLALKGVCSQRVEALATPKTLNSSFQPEKPVQWVVSDNAKNAAASARVQQLGMFNYVVRCDNKNDRIFIYIQSMFSTFEM
jgi:hypothetical protein